MKRVYCYIALRYNNTLSYRETLALDSTLLDKGSHVAMNSFHANPEIHI